MREKLKSTVKETDVVKKKLDEPLGGTNWDTFRGVSRAV